MNYADLLRSQVEALESERAALVDELDTLAPDETRTAEVVESRATEIAERGAAILADVAAKLARIGELDAISAERANVPKSPNFIRQPDALDVTDLRTMPAAKLVDTVTRSIEGNEIDPTAARKVLKRHATDREWLTGLAARSTDVYTEAWAKMMTGRELFLTTEERAAIAVGTNTSGGYLVPTHLDPTLILVSSGQSNAIRAMARVTTLTHEKTWNGVTTAGSTFSWDAETVEVSDDTPAFAAVSIPTFVGAGFVMASFQAFEDIANLAGDVAMVLADGRENLEAVAHATGNGSSAPKGIFTALDANTNVEVTSTTAATIGLVDLQGLRRSVPVRYRGNSKWLMNPVYADAIKALGTALGASYSGDLTQANSGTLLGSPVIESDEAPTTQTTTVRDNEVIVGDFSQYLIVDKPGSTTLEFIPNLLGSNRLPNGTRGWYMRFRSGADCINPLAFRLLHDKTTA